MEWFLKVVRHNYANFEGRARRKEYWMYVLFASIINVGLMIVAAIFGAVSDTLGGLLNVVGFLVSLGLVIPNLAVAVRRLHDTGRSGWHLLYGLIPFVGAVLLIVWMVQEGDRGQNAYGDDPKEGEHGFPVASGNSPFAMPNA